MVDQRFGTKANSEPESIPSFVEWCLKGPIILDGKPFSFERHEYLRGPYQDDHRWTVEEKAAQMGCTSRAMLLIVYSARYLSYRGILYFFPSRTDVSDFTKGRVDPLIDDNPDSIGTWIKDTDSANIKNIWNCFLYLRGMGSRIGLKSVPADFLVFDELDEAPQKAVSMAMKRLSHSEEKRVHMLSNPTLPDYGINEAFQTTDQRYWLLKCQKCSEYTCLEDTFPDCLVEFRGRVIRLCQHCRDRELDPSIGQWVAKKSSITDKRGYHYSQLFSLFVDPGEILHEFRTTNHLTNFYNLTIGIPYVEAENRLPVEAVLSLCGDEGIADHDDGPCSMGVDQGKDLHVVIGKKHLGKGGRIVHLGIYRDWEDLDGLMKNFHVSRCVADALPETRNARDFAKRWKGKVFLNFYNDNQKGSYAWDEEKLIVQCNRTESMDASHNQLMRELIILPRESDMVREFARHCNGVAKKLEEDEATGSKRYVYVRLKPDHFRHAFNYDRMAAEVMGKSITSIISLGTSEEWVDDSAKKQIIELPKEWSWIESY